MSPEPRVYDLLGQHADDSAFLVVRSREPAVLAQVRSIVRGLDPELAIYQVRTLEEMSARSIAPRRFLAGLVSAAALLSLIIAAVGVYGVMAYGVSQRRQEIGVRLALGAPRSSVLRMVLREGAVLAAIGGIAGLCLSYAAGRTFESLLAGVRPADPVTYSIAIAVALLMTLSGSLIPALRALRVDPVKALRAE